MLAKKTRHRQQLGIHQAGHVLQHNRFIRCFHRGNGVETGILVAVSVAGIGNLFTVITGELPTPFELCILEDVDLLRVVLLVGGEKNLLTLVSPDLVPGQISSQKKIGARPLWPLTEETVLFIGKPRIPDYQSSRTWHLPPHPRPCLRRPHTSHWRPCPPCRHSPLRH